MTVEERKYLTDALTRKYSLFNRGSKLWSTLYNWTLAVSAILSGAAAVILKINYLQEHYQLSDANLKDIGAVIAAAATIATTVAAGGGFGRKWQANRVSRGRVERLQVELSAPDAEAPKIRTQYEDILQKHDEAIIGSPVK